MDIVERIQDLAKSRGITGVQIGQALGLSKSPLTDWKNGKSKPTLDQVVSLCDFFAVSSDWLLYGEGKEYIDRSQAPEPAPQSGEVVLMAKGYGGKSEIITLSREDYEFAKTLFERLRRENEAERKKTKKKR